MAFPITLWNPTWLFSQTSLNTYPGHFKILFSNNALRRHSLQCLYVLWGMNGKYCTTFKFEMTNSYLSLASKSYHVITCSTSLWFPMALIEKARSFIYMVFPWSLPPYPPLPHVDLLVPWTYQAYSDLRALSLALPSALTLFPQLATWLLPYCLQFSSQMSPYP